MVIGLIFSWRISLIAIGLIPFLILGGAINVKIQAGMNEFDEEAYKDANLIAGDSIINYKTVASFGHDYLIVR